jgi:hypothetical protein
MTEDKAVEHALYVTKLADLNHYDNGFSRLYFGQEFCQRLIPPVKDLEQALDFAWERNLSFTFVTPYVTDEGLTKLGLLFHKVEKERPGSEVVFNDWGVLRILNKDYPNLEPVMGRLLNKMKRGPRLVNLLDTLPQTTLEYFKSCSLDVPSYQQFLLTNRVRRVELDNLLQGIDLDLSNSGISASLYMPYAYITTTRLCLAISCDVHGKEDEVGIFPCRRECQEYTFQMTHPVMPVPLIRKGNTIFFKNDEVPEDLAAKGVNRIVHQPEVPL